MEGLGREFNLIPTADAKFVNLAHCGGVTFIGVGSDTYTVQSSASASGGADLDVVESWHELSAADGSVAWTKHADQVADAAVLTSAAACAIYVDGKSLPDGHKYVKCTSSSTGLVYAIVHDLDVQRTPANLPALGV